MHQCVRLSMFAKMNSCVHYILFSQDENFLGLLQIGLIHNAGT